MDASVINIQLNENEEIEYVEVDPSDELKPAIVDAAHVDDDELLEPLPAPDEDHDDDNEDDETAAIDNAIEHDPGAVHDAVMGDQPSSDDDEANTVLVPNNDGSMTIKRKQKLIVEHVCGKCNKTYKSVAALKRHLNLCRHVPRDLHVAKELKKNLGRSMTTTSLADIAANECFCCFEDRATAHVGFMACNFCPKTFKSHINLERHLFTLHAPSKEFACHVCNAQCASAEIYEWHMESHGDGKPFACDKCGKEFTRKYHLDRHLEYTECDPERPKKKLPCNVCSKEFTRLDNLREHLRSHMGQAQRRKDYQCPYCEKSFFGSSLLNIHIRTHTGERPFPCDLCTNWFPSNGALRKHRRTHTGEKPYECEVCFKCFSVKETLNRHMKIHTGDRRHACPHCPKTFIQAQQLRAHIFYHTGENGFDCPHCSQRFNKRTRLEAHVKKIHESGTAMQCDVCQASFRFKSALTKHLREHIREAKQSAAAASSAAAAGTAVAGGAVRVKKERKEPSVAATAVTSAAATRIKREKSPLPPLPAIDEQTSSNADDDDDEWDEAANDMEDAEVLEDEEDEDGETIVPEVLPVSARALRQKRLADGDLSEEQTAGKRPATSVKVEQQPVADQKTPAKPTATTSASQPTTSTTDSGGPFACPHCDRVFTRKGPMGMHLRTHARETDQSNTSPSNAKKASATAAAGKSPAATAVAVTVAAAAVVAESKVVPATSGRKSDPAAAAKPAPAAKAPKAAARNAVTCKVCKQQVKNLNALVRHMKQNHPKFFMQMFADDGNDDDDEEDGDNSDNDKDDGDDNNNADGSGDDDDDDDRPNGTAGDRHEEADGNDDNDGAPAPAGKSAAKPTQRDSRGRSQRAATRRTSENGAEDDETTEIEPIPMKEEEDDDAADVKHRRTGANNDAAADAVEELPDGLGIAQLTDSIGKLLALLVDEQTLTGFGWPQAPCDLVLRRVIAQCGQRPATVRSCPDRAQMLRENAELLFTSVISNDAIKALLNNHTVDEVIVHVLKMAN